MWACVCGCVCVGVYTLCVCVCVCVCKKTPNFVRNRVSFDIFIVHQLIYACMYIYVYICICICIYVHMRVCLHSYYCVKMGVFCHIYRTPLQFSTRSIMCVSFHGSRSLYNWYRSLLINMGLFSYFNRTSGSLFSLMLVSFVGLFGLTWVSFHWC